MNIQTIAKNNFHFLKNAKNIAFTSAIHSEITPKTNNLNGANAVGVYNLPLIKPKTIEIALEEDKSVNKLITGLKLYNDYGPDNDAIRSRMFTENHELPEDWLKAYEDDYELDFDIPFAKTGKTYGETFKTPREYAEFKSDPLRARTSQLKKIKKHIKPADKEYILYRGLGPSTPHQVIEMLESAKINDVIIPDWGVACATSDLNYALKHYSDKILLKIKTPVGACLAGLYKDGFPEFHMPSMSEYKFVGSSEIGGVTVYELEYIMPDLTNI